MSGLKVHVFFFSQFPLHIAKVYNNCLPKVQNTTLNRKTAVSLTTTTPNGIFQEETPLYIQPLGASLSTLRPPLSARRSGCLALAARIVKHVAGCTNGDRRTDGQRRTSSPLKALDKA